MRDNRKPAKNNKLKNKNYNKNRVKDPKEDDK